MKKKLILLVLVVVIAAGAGLVLPNKISKIGKENTITSSQLEKAIDTVSYPPQNLSIMA